MPSLRLVAQQALIGFATLAAALASRPPAGFTTRSISLPSGQTATIHENPALVFRAVSNDPSTPKLRHAKRLSYQPYTGTAGRSDYCGEAFPSFSSGGAGGGAATASDCHALELAYSDPVKGWWAIDAADFAVAAAAAAAPGGEVTLATSGTCKFSVKTSEGTPESALFGTNDIRFYLNQAQQGAVGGKIGASSSVSCNKAPGVSVSLTWTVSKA
ncbi:hypothetical protein B0T25DRAFT_235247 [Lasiosphaeria hispida]|uniref:Ecp2 effector protein-like domain-containing protein n=1 Tax=Lasiosphaeria hispida TaxID=260671 RepID=A0AAJ0MCE3_9PEZI|nr:hypothetical protein B0T25DRAFT_235247 [Lasiosphaeria hispida]